MRHLMLMVLGLGLLGAVVGCNTVHGVCDCDRPEPSVLQAEPPASPGVVASAPIHAEPISTTPKAK